MSDVVLIAVKVKQGSEDFRSSSRVNFKEVDLDALLLLCLVEILRQVLDETMHVTQVDQRPWVSKLALHEEVLDSLGVVEGGFLDYFLYVSESAESCASLDVLKVDFWVVSMW